MREPSPFPSPCQGEGRRGEAEPGEGHLTDRQKADLCASFQYTAGESVCDRAAHAMRAFRQSHPASRSFVLAGGVAANQYLRDRLEAIAAEHGMTLIAPPVALCTDNAAMIAWAGIERFRLGMTDGLDFEPRARWPLANQR